MRMSKICECCVIICLLGLTTANNVTFGDSGILSYSMPVGQTTEDGKLSYDDTSYNGVVVDDFYKNGTGILTDDKFGRIKFTEKYKGEGWVGWSSFLTKSQYIDIIFEFSAVRKFTSVTLNVHVDTERGHAVFNQSQIFFSSTEDGFSDTSLLQCYTREFPAKNDPYNAYVTLSLCENTARFIKLRLYFGGQWLLITEISFNSVSARIADETMKDCSGNTAAAVCTATQLSTGGSSTTPIPRCEDCTTLTSSGSSNLQLTIIIVCVILLIVIVLLVVIFLLYRRRALCFGKMTQRNKTDQTVHVELHRVENLETGDMQNESSREPEAMQNNQLIKEPDYSAAGNGIVPYEEVQISPPSVYAQLDKNRQNETNEDTYQKLLKYDSDYVIPAHTNAEYEVVGEIQSLPGYTELDNTKRVHDDSAFYQKLEKK